MEIHVTQQHIQNGVAKSHHACPIALALGDVGIPLEGGGSRGVNKREINCPDGYRVPLSEAMQAFIDDFDAGMLVTPQVFEFPDATYHAVNVPTAELVTV